MRKAATVIGLGAFFVTMALLLRFYAYDRLAVVPLDQNTQQVIDDPNATFFDADKVAPGAGTLTTKVTVVGDEDASRRASKQTGKDVFVFDQWRSSDNNNQAPPMDAWTGRYAIDRHTGEAIDCCNTTNNGKPVTYSGQIIKFPFQTQKKTYDYWDNTVGKAVPLAFTGEEKIDGLNTYKFQGDVSRTKFRTQDVPRKIFGLSDQSAQADRFYENDRTVWVEPETGVIIKVQEKQHQVLKISDPGAKEVNALTTNSVMTPATVANNVEDYKTKATLLKVLRLWAPLLLGLLGILLIVAGLLMSVRVRADRRRGEDTVSWDEMSGDGEELAGVRQADGGRSNGASRS